jgi:hypothetical protein
MRLPPVFDELGIGPGSTWGSVNSVGDKNPGLFSSNEPSRLIGGGYIPPGYSTESMYKPWLSSPVPAPSSSGRVYWGGLGDDPSGIDPKKLKILAVGGAVALLALYLIFRKRK